MPQPFPPDRPTRPTPSRSAGTARVVRSARRRLPAWLALGTAGALVAGACSSGHASSNPAPSGSTTLAAPTSTTEPPPQYPPSPYSWDRSASPGLALGGGAGATLAAVIAPTVDEPWLAVGTRRSAAGVPEPTVWTSADGVAWKSSPIVATPVAGSALAASQYRGETVVVGSVGEGANRQAAAWISPSPGAPFTAVSVPLTGGPSTMSVVAAGALGMFATGTVDGRFAVWSSTDGTHWSEQPDAEKTITSASGARVWSLLAEGDAVYAAGSVGSGADQAAAVWTTTDGLHWRSVTTAATAFSGPGSRAIYSLSPLGNGLVAGGAVNRGSGWVPASWVSPDGASWSPPSTDFPGATAAGPPGAAAYGPSGGWAIRSVSAVPTFVGSATVVAAGGGPYGEGAWRSTDGLHWTALPLPGPDATAGGWRATLAAATISTTVVADGEPGQAHLIAETGSTWAEPSADPAVFGPVRPTAVPVSLVPSGGRLVMTVRVEADPQAIGAPAVTYATLASDNGVDWAPVPAGTAAPPTVPTAGALTQQLSTGWVAVGQPASGRPEGWTSPDGRAWTAQGLLDGSAGGGAGGAGAGSGSSATTEVPGPALAATANGLCTLDTPPAAVTAPTTGAPAAGTPTTAPATAGAGGPAGHSLAVAAVGSALQPATGGAAEATVQGHQAAAWVSVAGTGWRRASVNPAPATGGFETMFGCTRTSDGLMAWGASTASGGASVPAIWRSATGSAWNRVSVAAFTPASPEPLTDLAAYGSVEMAVADPDPATASGGAGPVAASGAAGATGPAPTLENGEAGVWLSTDGGSTWQAVDTAAPPWLGTDGSAAGLVGFVGATPVLAGTVDGQLAVWTGAPAGGAAAGPNGG